MFTDALKYYGVSAGGIAAIVMVWFLWTPVSKMFETQRKVDGIDDIAKTAGDALTIARANAKELTERRVSVSKIANVLRDIQAANVERAKLLDRILEKRRLIEANQKTVREQATRLTITEALATSNKQTLKNHGQRIGVNDKFREEQQPRGARRTVRLDDHKNQLNRLTDFTVQHNHLHLGLAEQGRRDLLNRRLSRPPARLGRKQRVERLPWLTTLHRN